MEHNVGGVGSQPSNQSIRVPNRLPTQTESPASTNLSNTPASSGVEITLSNLSIDDLNKGMLQAERDYQTALIRGDQKGAEAAVQTASNLRSKGGTASVDMPLEQASTPSNSGTSARYGIGASEEGNRVFKDYRDGSVIYIESDGEPEVLVGPKRPNVELQNIIVEAAKVKYLRAHILQDGQARHEAMQQASMARQRGATIGVNEDTALTSALKRYAYQPGVVQSAISSRKTYDLNQAIVQLKNDFAYAQNTNDPAGKEAARIMADILRRLGGTIGPDVSLEEAKKIVSAGPIAQPPAGSASEPKRDELYQRVLGFVTGAGVAAGKGLLDMLRANADPLGTVFRGVHGIIESAPDVWRAAVDWEETVAEINGLLGKLNEYYKDADPYEKGRMEGEVLVSAVSLIIQGKSVTIRNGSLAGSIHPSTGVYFDLAGFPIFNYKHQLDLPEKYYKSGATRHKEIANRMLREEVLKDPALRSKFTESQLEEILGNDDPENYKPPQTPTGYVWHHHQDVGRMQLVERDVHFYTGHTGGMKIWGEKKK